MTEPIANPPPGFDRLPVEEQIDYIQTLWDRVAATPERVPVPPWHVEELRRREEEYRGGQQPLSTWEEVRARMLRLVDRKR